MTEPTLDKLLSLLPSMPALQPTDAHILLIEAQGNLETIDCTIEHFETSTERLSPSEMGVLKDSRRDVALKVALRALALWQSLNEQEKS